MNHDMPRVPMVPKHQHDWIADDDVKVRLEPPRIGRRLSMDIDEAALAQIGKQGLAHATKRIAEEIAYRHQGDIQRAVDTLLMDASWIKPIIEQELRSATREFVLALWSDDEKKNLRDWFDIFTAKCRGE